MTTIISFISQKGGVGKSILSQALAVEATKAGLRTLLFDYDLQQSTSKTVWAEDRLQNNLAPSIEVIAASQLETKKFSLYDLVIIDGPANTTKATINISLHSDLVIQPTGATSADLKTATLEFNTLLKNGINPQKIFFIFNQILTSSQEARARTWLAKYYPSCRVLPISIPSRVSYANAQDEGKAITEINHQALSHKARSLIASIVEEINKL